VIQATSPRPCEHPSMSLEGPSQTPRGWEWGLPIYLPAALVTDRGALPGRALGLRPRNLRLCHGFVRLSIPRRLRSGISSTRPSGMCRARRRRDS
jgi:hypothetical protein